MYVYISVIVIRPFQRTAIDLYAEVYESEFSMETPYFIIIYIYFHIEKWILYRKKKTQYIRIYEHSSFRHLLRTYTEMTNFAPAYIKIVFFPISPGYPHLGIYDVTVCRFYSYYFFLPYPLIYIYVIQPVLKVLTKWTAISNFHFRT